jgi:hypothetical protein
MQRDTTGLIIILIQTLVGIAGLTIIALQLTIVSRQLTAIAELIAKTH